MPETTIMCDRCGMTVREWVDGLTLDDSKGISGFYSVKNTHWERFAIQGEVMVCDSCVWSDPRYIAEYGEHE